ncbi:MAG: DUF4290 domain-containing protein [Muribaculaceae bacterium]|nr:DUF4290 domain-containing protein [Muribaculaceae bacterium]
MIEYNTALPKLEMREYGRNIQKLVDHCVAIQDRDERNRCAQAIADIMMQLFPELKSDTDNNRKIWEHLNIISGFKLDIDFPCEVLGENELRPAPATIPYSHKSERFRVYGSNLIKMIKEISKMEGGVDKDRLIFLVANQMKKLLVSVNADSATDRRVFNDIREITSGGIDIDPESYRLNDYIGVVSPQEGKKKKKK